MDQLGRRSKLMEELMAYLEGEDGEALRQPASLTKPELMPDTESREGLMRAVELGAPPDSEAQSMEIGEERIPDTHKGEMTEEELMMLLQQMGD